MKDKVTIYGKEYKLDKLLIVTLDGNFDPRILFDEFGINKLCSNCTFKGVNAFYFNDLCKFVRQRSEVIVTPLTKFVDHFMMELGYDIIVQSGDKYIVFSDLLMGNSDKSFGREIRVAQNWEKMLYAGCFDLDIPDWRDKV